MAWQGIEAPKQTIEFPAAPTFFPSKKWIKLIPKTIGNRKRDGPWGYARRIITTSENLQIEKHKSIRWAERTPSWILCFSICRFSQVVFILRAQPHAQSLFLFPIVFGINLRRDNYCNAKVGHSSTGTELTGLSMSNWGGKSRRNTQAGPAGVCCLLTASNQPLITPS